MSTESRRSGEQIFECAANCAVKYLLHLPVCIRLLTYFLQDEVELT